MREVVERAGDALKLNPCVRMTQQVQGRAEDGNVTRVGKWLAWPDIAKAMRKEQTFTSSMTVCRRNRTATPKKYWIVGFVKFSFPVLFHTFVLLLTRAFSFAPLGAKKFQFRKKQTLWTQLCLEPVLRLRELAKQQEGIFAQVVWIGKLSANQLVIFGGSGRGTFV